MRYEQSGDVAPCPAKAGRSTVRLANILYCRSRFVRQNKFPANAVPPVAKATEGATM